MFLMPIAHRRVANGHVHDLSRAFDRLFDEDAASVFASPAAAGNVSRLPALDLRETEQAYSVSVDLPGVAKDEIKITIDGKRVSVETSARSEAPAAEGERQLLRERSTVAYARSLTLPVEIDETASSAKLENGVLNLTLAKKVKPASQLAIA